MYGNDPVRAEIPGNGEVLHGDIAGRVVVGIPAAGGHEIRPRDGRLHRGEAGAVDGVEQGAEHGVLLRLRQGVQAHHPGLEECCAKAIHALKAGGVVDAEGYGAGRFRRLKVEGRLGRDAVAGFRGDVNGHITRSSQTHA